MNFWQMIQSYWNENIWIPLTSVDVTVIDVIDAVLMALLLCGVYYVARGRRIGKMLIGLLAVFALYGVSVLFEFRALHLVLSKIVSLGVVICAVIFNEEIRDALEKLGNLLSDLRFVSKEEAELTHTTDAIVSAVIDIAGRDRDGALIVIERKTGLGEHIEKGAEVDSVVSSKLLSNIFIDKSPLHDGAVIIRKNRIAAACCKLPLSNNESVVANYGTRHRAAVGISEASDCVVVVVSEEKHIISVMCNGLIKRDYNLGVVDSKIDVTDPEVAKRVRQALWDDLYKLIVGKTDTPKRKRRREYKVSDETGVTDAEGVDGTAADTETNA